MDDEYTQTTNPIANASERNGFPRRNVVAGLAALGLASGVGITRVFAQDATPAATDETGVGSSGTDTSTADTSRATRYQAFVAALADTLGLDATSVDTGIRDALTSLVDDALTAGDISANDATARKEQIAASDAPLFLGAGRGNHGTMGDGAKGKGHDDMGGPDTDLPKASPTATS